MALQTIGLGTVANDGTGDNLRTAGSKINGNFAELYALVMKIGTSAQRPTGLTSAQIVWFYDTTLGKPITWIGTGWVDATGAAVAAYVAPVLASLLPVTMSFTVGAAAGTVIGTFTNRTSGSTITFAPTNSGDANKIAINSSGQPVVGSVPAAAGASISGTLTETLVGATNSPRTTAVTFSVVAATSLVVRPSITGVPRVGLTLQGYPGNAASPAYQWLTATTASGTGTAISGATAATYVPQAGDAGNFLSLQVTPSGGSPVTSEPTAIVLAAPDTLLLPDGTALLLPDSTPLLLPIAVDANLLLFAPYSTSSSSFNIFSDPSQGWGYSVLDADRFVPATSGVPICIRAPNTAKLVQVVGGNGTTGFNVLASFTPDSFHYCTGTIDLSVYKNGPRYFEVRAYDQPVVANAASCVQAGFFLYLVGGSNVDTSALPTGATGMALQFNDDFTSLSISNSTTNDGSTWYTHTPYNGDFGDAVFTNRGSSRDPFSNVGSFLRIRAQYDTTIVDNANRVWYAGLLSSAFPDGTTNANTGNGYYEVRALVPVGRGVWPAPSWLLNLDSIKHASSQNGREVDLIEYYNTNETFYYSTQHRYTNGTDNATGNKITTGDLRWEFHRFGAKITSSAIYYYFDDQLMATDNSRFNTGATNDAVNYMLINFAMGSGYPTTPPPPSGNYDMYIDYMRYYS